MSFGMTMWNLNIEKKQKAETRYMDTDSFLVYVKTNHIYEVIAEDVEKRLDKLCVGKTTTIKKTKSLI